ncbi:MAG: 30S ribosomal protein S8 [Rhodospirillaceae bacterium]|nr:30S ribosomal protein S8 [Rhodospirillaceae bacterium]|tara:strand:+ start:567 stop:965 length:399 start_codon:yes stop_codon:yes gene_type:complete
MSMTDPIADMITRIRNGQGVGKGMVLSPASTLRAAILDVLEGEGYIRGYKQTENQEGKAQFEIELKYSEGKPVIREIIRVSKPGRRVYSSMKDLPRVYNGLGISILSTSSGVMSDLQARKKNLGGEILCQVF